MEISKVRIPSGTILNIKDTTARTRLSELSNVENKNVAAIKEEILTSENVKTALNTGTDDGTFLAKDGTWKAPAGGSSVQSDWNEADSTSGAYINNKPTLAAVATSGSYNDLNNKPTLFSGDYDDLTNKPTIPSTYGDVAYNIASQSTSGAVTIDGSIPLHIITCTGNISSVALSTNPTAGHSCHVIFFATAARTVAIAHDATARVCPEAKNLSLSITANGYVEVDFLSDGTKVYVRGV